MLTHCDRLGLTLGEVASHESIRHGGGGGAQDQYKAQHDRNQAKYCSLTLVVLGPACILGVKPSKLSTVKAWIYGGP